MRIREMTLGECAAVLERSEVGRLACARDAQPYIVPIHFAYDGEHCYGLTTAGQKIDWMRSNPCVCLEVDERSSHQRWLSIVMMGRYEELPESAACEGARAHALELLQRRELWWQPASVARRGREQRAPIFYRIHIVQMTGLCAEPDAVGIAMRASD
ncbi:MAG TPA: pyridoxamine 5'-phosphate oxidase family protein [Steroidobacteraceae bacterium]|nr:pyridoxamine 5'-phosphate oxidase family protein [Steroidobacteraceae bacterium]